MGILSMFILLVLTEFSNMLAQPKGFTDDPYVDDEKFIEKVVKHEVVGVVGEGVAIPCNCTPAYSHAGDKPALILWYKDKAKMPIYSFDLRSPSSDGQHWKDHNTLGDRGYVFYEESPHSCKSSLNIEPVSVPDSGQYRCRVDYDTSPTRNTRIKLKLVARPTKPVIYSDDGMEILHRTRPVKLGANLKLYCTSEGGDPAPSINWRRGGVPVSAVGQDVDNISGRVTSTAIISGLKLSDQGAQVTCTADNSALIQPQTTSVILDVIVPPVRSKIVKEINHFTAGHVYNVTCQVLGSRPSALTNIWIGDKKLNLLSTKASLDGNISTSMFFFLPEMDDNDKHLTCEATNELIPDVVVRDTWKIGVHYTPVVYLSKVGNSSVAKLGEDITLKCIIQSNPTHHTVIWTREGKNLESELGEGSNIHILDDALHLSNVDESNSGDYTCTVTNAAGTVKSNIVTVTVADAPSCTSNKTKVVEADIGEETQLDCSMKWGGNLIFTWSKITHLDRKTTIIPGTEVTSKGSMSVLRYTPETSSDFAEIRCGAMDTEGSSGHACIYQIILREDTGVDVTECNTYNQTFSSFTIECSLSPETSIHQDQTLFIFEIKNAHTEILLRNLSSPIPKLSVDGLPSASDFRISVFSNTNGKRSKPFNLEGFTTRPGEKQLATMPEIETKNKLRFTPLLGVILLISLVLVLLTIAVVAVVRRKISRASNSPSSQLELINNQKQDLDYSPDIIPKDSGYGYYHSVENLENINNSTFHVLTTANKKSKCLDKGNTSSPGLQFDISVSNSRNSCSPVPNIGLVHISSSGNPSHYTSMHQNLNTFKKTPAVSTDKWDTRLDNSEVLEDSKKVSKNQNLAKKQGSSSRNPHQEKYTTLARMEKIHQNAKKNENFNQNSSSTLKRVKFVDQEMVKKDSTHYPEMSRSLVHLCPMHQHKLAISPSPVASSSLSVSISPLVVSSNEGNKTSSRQMAETNKKVTSNTSSSSMPLQTYKDVEFKL